MHMVDSAYGVYPDLKSLTVDGIPFGYRILPSNSRKMNTKSSIESKVGVVSDYLSYNMYMKLIEHSIPRQPEWNKAKENGKKSCTDKSRHVYILYCSLKDLVDSNNMPIAYYSTENVLADFFTKNLLEEFFWIYVT